jgi:hypothetical protein
MADPIQVPAAVGDTTDVDNILQVFADAPAGSTIQFQPTMDNNGDPIGAGPYKFLKGRNGEEITLKLQGGEFDFYGDFFAFDDTTAYVGLSIDKDLVIKGATRDDGKPATKIEAFESWEDAITDNWAGPAGTGDWHVHNGAFPDIWDIEFSGFEWAGFYLWSHCNFDNVYFTRAGQLYQNFIDNTLTYPHLAWNPETGGSWNMDFSDPVRMHVKNCVHNDCYQLSHGGGVCEVTWENNEFHGFTTNPDLAPWIYAGGESLLNWPGTWEHWVSSFTDVGYPSSSTALRGKILTLEFSRNFSIKNNEFKGTLVPANTGAITAFADGSGGKVEATASGHTLSNTDEVIIRGTAYDGRYVVSEVSAGVSFKFVATFVATDTGTWEDVTQGTSPYILLAHGPMVGSVESVQLKGNLFEDWDTQWVVALQNGGAGTNTGMGNPGPMKNVSFCENICRRTTAPIDAEAKSAQYSLEELRISGNTFVDLPGHPGGVNGTDTGWHGNGVSGQHGPCIGIGKKFVNGYIICQNNYVDAGLEKINVNALNSAAIIEGTFGWVYEPDSGFPSGDSVADYFYFRWSPPKWNTILDESPCNVVVPTTAPATLQAIRDRRSRPALRVAVGP